MRIDRNRPSRLGPQFHHDQFERSMRRGTAAIFAWFIFSALLSAAVLGFLGWALYRVVMHFT